MRLATVTLVVLALYQAQAVLIPVALAILLSFALRPPASWLERHGLRRTPSSLLVTAAALALIVGLGAVAGTQLSNLGTRLPEFSRNIAEKLQPIQGLLKSVERAEKFGAPDPVTEPGGQPPDPNNPLPGQPADGSRGPVPVTVVKPKGSEALAWLPTIVVPVVEVLATALLVTVLTVFMLVQRESVRDRFLTLAGRGQLTATTRALEDAGHRVSKYLLLQASTNASMGSVVALGLWAIGVPYAALWGLLSASLRFVPYVGIWISALFPLTLAVAEFPGWTPAILVLLLYGVCDNLLSSAIEPLLFGHGTGVSSLALLIAAAFWAFLWGPVGLLLAVPMTVCLAVLGEHVPSLKFLSTLLGDATQVDPATQYFHRVLSHHFDQATLLVQEQAAGRPLLEVYDEMMLPALALAKTGRDSGDLSRAEEGEFYETTADVLHGVLARVRAEAAGEGATAPVTVAPAVACSTKGEADRLALAMLRDVVRAAGGELDIVPAADLVAAVRERAKGNKKVVACVAAVSPGGLPVVAGLCKQLKAAVPNATILVGRWGMTTDMAETEKFLTAAGATKVTWKLRETLAEIAPDATPKPHKGVETDAGPDKVTVPK